MRGYWEDPETTAKVYRPGPTPEERILYSGDLFRMDEDGFLYFVSRKDDIIKSRGEKVSPKEVENVLYSIEGVVEAAVVGIPDQKWGEKVVAAVVKKPGSDVKPQEIQTHCKLHLHNWKCPKEIAFVDELPRNTMGKVLKEKVQEFF